MVIEYQNILFMRFNVKTGTQRSGAANRKEMGARGSKVYPICDFQSTGRFPSLSITQSEGTDVLNHDN